MKPQGPKEAKKIAAADARLPVHPRTTVHHPIFHDLIVFVAAVNLILVLVLKSTLRSDSRLFFCSIKFRVEFKGLVGDQ